MYKNQFKRINIEKFTILDGIQRNINLTLDIGGSAGAALKNDGSVVTWGNYQSG